MQEHSPQAELTGATPKRQIRLDNTSKISGSVYARFGPFTLLPIDGTLIQCDAYTPNDLSLHIAWASVDTGNGINMN